MCGAYPQEWMSGSNAKYEEGDMVSVGVSTAPIYEVACECKTWPFSSHYGQYSPTKCGGN